ncbi:Mor transcription activator family protein [Achromobacter xylosoxidans]
MTMIPEEFPSVRRRHKTLQEMAEIFGVFLMEKLQISAEEAAALGDELIDLMHRHCGGQSLYFPKDRGYLRLEHDIYIWRHFQRGNASEIAAHLGVSYVYVYQRYRVMRAEARRRAQPQLPGMDSPDTDGA